MELFLKLPVHMVWSSDQVNGKIISVVQFISCLQHLFWVHLLRNYNRSGCKVSRLPPPSYVDNHNIILNVVLAVCGCKTISLMNLLVTLAVDYCQSLTVSEFEI